MTPLQADSAMINDHDRILSFPQTPFQRPQALPPAESCPRCAVLEKQLQNSESALDEAHEQLQNVYDSSRTEIDELRRKVEELLTRSTSDSLAIDSLRTALRKERAQQKAQQRSASPFQKVSIASLLSRKA